MEFVPHPAWFWDSQDALIDRACSRGLDLQGAIPLLIVPPSRRKGFECGNVTRRIEN
jgi:hypothetical protein